MDVFLYQLNISGLTISAIVIAMFFVVLSRLIPRVEMRWWTNGWIANVAALAITGAFWAVQPPAAVHSLWFTAYMVAKTCYVWMLLRGALEFGAIRPRWLRSDVVLGFLIAVGAPSILFLTTRDRLGLAASIVLAVGFGTGAVTLAPTRAAAANWLLFGFGLRAVHAAVEAAAYAINVAAEGHLGESAFAVPANLLLAAHYSLGIGAEWLLAMGCVIAVSARTQTELQLANRQLLQAQEGLRRLADRDPLTALANRRALPGVLRAVQPVGAVLIFFDLDDFKRINDDYGHQAGDRCLVRFADALTHSFRPKDAVVRYAGDEFLVVASGLSARAIEERIAAVRARLDDGELPIRFSFGLSHLPAGGNPDEALRAADDEMYRAKTGRGALALSS